MIMKSTIAIALLIITPCIASAQQSAPCEISHWSTTGAACSYAPDMPEAKMRVEKSWGAMSTPVDAPATNFGKSARVLPELQGTPGQRDTSVHKRKYLKWKKLQKPIQKSLPPPGTVVKPPVPNPEKMPIVPGDTLTKAQPK